MTPPARWPLKALADLAAWICGLSFLALFVVNIAAVFGRYTGLYSLLWSLDLTRWLFVWVVFFGAAAATRSRSHLAVDFLRDLLPRQLQRLAVIVGHLLLLVLLSVFIVHGWRFGMARMAVPFVQLGMAQGWAYLSLPVGSALMALFTVEALVDDVRSRRRSAAETTE